MTCFEGELCEKSVGVSGREACTQETLHNRVSRFGGGETRQRERQKKTSNEKTAQFSDQGKNLSGYDGLRKNDTGV